MTSKILNIKPDSALFLDRDGVINRRLPGTYVKYVSEFDFLEGVLDAIAIFSKIFKHIFVVTNQQGIGKGYMTKEDLGKVHKHLLEEVNQKGGRIDKVYFAPQLAKENHILRKPNQGMAHLAKEEFPEIDLSSSVMVGDSISDMEFGNNAGMQNVFINSDPDIRTKDLPVLLRFDSLYDFSIYLHQLLSTK
jgi:histidinol-phosphate phosphatase family protein